MVWRAALAVAAAIVLYFGVDAWIGDRSILHVTGLGTRPIDLLDPRWLLLIAMEERPLHGPAAKATLLNLEAAA